MNKTARAAKPMPLTDKVALFMDFDGTLVDFETNPADVTVPSSTLGLLSLLQEKTDGALAIISGRSISDLDRMLSPLAIAASGCLGAEMRLRKDGDIYALAEPIPADIVAELSALAERMPGVTFENKTYGAALHYRDAPEARSILENELPSITRDLQRNVKIVFTECTCEIIGHNYTKGTAVRNFFLTPHFKDKMPVYIGNDILDREAFVAVRAMGGIGLYVGDRYVSPEVDFTLNSVDEVHKWLETV